MAVQIKVIARNEVTKQSIFNVEIARKDKQGELNLKVNLASTTTT